MEPPFPGRHGQEIQELSFLLLQIGDGREFSQGLTSGTAGFLQVPALPVHYLKEDRPWRKIGAPVTQPTSERPGGRIFRWCEAWLTPSRVASHWQAGEACSLNTTPSPPCSSVPQPPPTPSLVNLCVLHSPAQNHLVWRTNTTPPHHRNPMGQS